ncbi:MAG: transporter [Burkholderiales bacterium]
MSIPVLTYGAERTGLICGFRFDPDAPGQALTSDEAVEWLGARAADVPRSFAWLHFDLAGAVAERWMRDHLGLPDGFFESLHEGSRSTRIERADDCLVAVVNDVLFDFAFGPSHVSTLWACVRPDLVVTARRKPLRSVDRLRLAVRDGETFLASADILTHLLHDQVDVLAQIVRAATSRVDEIEDTLLANRLEPRNADLGATRRVLVRLRRLLAPEPAALFRLLGHPPAWIGADQVQGLREATEEFSIGLNDMSSLLERIKLVQEEIAAQVNEQNNRSLFLLTIFTVLALPINIVAGLFGMNVGGIPLGQDERGFWTIVGIVAAFTVPALWIVLRRRRTGR